MVKPHFTPFREGDVGENILIGHLNQAVLNVFWVDKLPMINDPELLQQRGAHETVKIRSGK